MLLCVPEPKSPDQESLNPEKDVFRDPELYKYIIKKKHLCCGLPMFAVFMTCHYWEIVKVIHSVSYLMTPVSLLHISVRAAQDECG